MPPLQEIPSAQIERTLRAAVRAGVRVVITARFQNRWMTYTTFPLAVHEDQFWAAVPEEPMKVGHRLRSGERVGVSFVLAQQKYVFAALVADTSVVELDDGTEVAAMGLGIPEQIHRVEKRLYGRAEIPSARIVRASFWLGGIEAEPSDTMPDQPVWSGRIVNLSEGGFSVRTSHEAAKCIEAGDVVGVRLTFADDGTRTLYADAQFRHGEADGAMVLMGFEFIGMDRSEEGKEAIRAIRSEVEQYTRQGQGTPV